MWLPIVFLAMGGLTVATLVATRPTAEPRPPEVRVPLVRAVRAEPQQVQYSVEASGTVMPRTQSDLVPQVSGEVTWVSPELASGGFFAEGESLVRIDPRDYEADVESGRATVARARSEFARSRTERKRQRELAERSVASQARIDDAENDYRVAEAQLREATSALERAERDLERTELHAPFEGRVREENVDVGQFVNRGTPIAKLYSVDAAEVSLPIPDRDLSYLDLDLVAPREGVRSGPEVILHADFAGRSRTWRGRVVRTEGEIDMRSRMVNVVARVDHPYAEDPPLAVGLFVRAEILGRRVDAAFLLPRTALREGPEGEQVLVIDDDDRLHFRAVEVLRSRRDEVVVGGGISPGERVVVTPLGAPVEGMQVRVVIEADAEPPASG